MRNVLILERTKWARLSLSARRVLLESMNTVILTDDKEFEILKDRSTHPKTWFKRPINALDAWIMLNVKHEVEIA